MANVQTQIRIDEELKKNTTEIFSHLGLNFSEAVTMFLRQVEIQGGLPFEVKLPKYKPEVFAAIKEAETIAQDSNAKSYNSFADILAEIEEETEE